MIGRYPYYDEELEKVETSEVPDFFPAAVITAVGVDHGIKDYLKHLNAVWTEATTSRLVAQLDKLGLSRDERKEVSETLYGLHQRYEVEDQEDVS